MKQHDLGAIQHTHSVDYTRGLERHRVVTRVHETGVSITAFHLKGGQAGKHRVLWQAASLDGSTWPAVDFSAVRGAEI